VTLVRDLVAVAILAFALAGCSVPVPSAGTATGSASAESPLPTAQVLDLDAPGGWDTQTCVGGNCTTVNAYGLGTRLVGNVSGFSVKVSWNATNPTTTSLTATALVDGHAVASATGTSPISFSANWTRPGNLRVDVHATGTGASQGQTYRVHLHVDTTAAALP